MGFQIIFLFKSSHIFSDLSVLNKSDNLLQGLEEKDQTTKPALSTKYDDKITGDQNKLDNHFTTTKELKKDEMT